MEAGHGRDRYASAELKVFWFFSSEKNNLAFLACVSQGGKSTLRSISL
jgi:hypothetical protein